MDKRRLNEARILIVAGEKADVRVLERILRAAGWTNLKSTFDARDMRALVARYRPDLILLDLHMPHASGLEVLEDLHATFAGGAAVPVLIVSADITPEAKQAALGAGASDFLTKPIDATDVLPRVWNLLEVRFRRLLDRDRTRVLEEQVWERTRAFEEYHVEMLERLALAAEYRDDLTRGEHVRRVGQTCALLARGLGLPQEQVEMIRLAAPLHDLGKIAIPERILLKPARLTPEEFEVMKTHTTIGAAMLAGSHQPLLQMAERIARSHHERWEGAGFPEGLRGEAIPVEARIVAVADAFDAMNSDRPYRQALSSEEVWDILVDGAGRQWDLTVVDALASLVRMEVQVDRPFDLAAFLEREQMALDPRR